MDGWVREKVDTRIFIAKKMFWKEESEIIIIYYYLQSDYYKFDTF